MTSDATSLFALAILSLVLFCICAACLIHVARKPVPAFNATPYTKAALRVKKTYGIFAWGLMTSTFLLGLVMSFVDVYTQL